MAKNINEKFKPCYVMVYGTLMKGHGNHRLLDDNDYIGEATIKGLCVDVGAFPAYVDEGDNIVIGEIYKVSSKRQMIYLDSLEGYTGNEHDSMYLRKLKTVSVTIDNKETELNAYIYVWNYGFSNNDFIVPSGMKWDDRNVLIPKIIAMKNE